LFTIIVNNERFRHLLFAIIENNYFLYFLNIKELYIKYIKVIKNKMDDLYDYVKGAATLRTKGASKVDDSLLPPTDQKSDKEVEIERKSAILGYENMSMFSNYQFSCGDQSKESRNKFGESDFKICPQCNSSEIDKKHDIAGGRMNGDCYGTDVFICKSCNWITSFQWDEGGDSPYYYEIQYLPYFEKKWEEIQEKNRKIEQSIRKNREERRHKAIEEKKQKEEEEKKQKEEEEKKQKE
jgi:hypothetical protein